MAELDFPAPEAATKVLEVAAEEIPVPVVMELLFSTEAVAEEILVPLMMESLSPTEAAKK